MQTEPVIKPKLGDIRKLVLPGGGDWTTRVWARIRANVHAMQICNAKGIFRTAAVKAVKKQLEQFAHAKTKIFEHSWQTATEREALQIKCEIFFLLDAVEKEKKYRKQKKGKKKKKKKKKKERW